MGVITWVLIFIVAKTREKRQKETQVYQNNTDEESLIVSYKRLIAYLETTLSINFTLSGKNTVFGGTLDANDKLVKTDVNTIDINISMWVTVSRKDSYDSISVSLVDCIGREKKEVKRWDFKLSDSEQQIIDIINQDIKHSIPCFNDRRKQYIFEYNKKIAQCNISQYIFEIEIILSLEQSSCYPIVKLPKLLLNNAIHSGIEYKIKDGNFQNKTFDEKYFIELAKSYGYDVKYTPPPEPWSSKKQLSENDYINYYRKLEKKVHMREISKHMEFEKLKANEQKYNFLWKLNYDEQKLKYLKQRAHNIEIINEQWPTIIKRRWKESSVVEANEYKRTENPRRGLQEDLFFELLMNKMHKYVRIDYMVYGYFPDIIFNIDNIHFIDIEIDEPYTIENNHVKEIHYIDCGDEGRNEVFVKNNWFVIRFAESQIKQYPKECAGILKCLVKFIIFGDCIFLTELKELSATIQTKRWTKEEARLMAITKTRSDTSFDNPKSSKEYNRPLVLQDIDDLPF